jgi:hypothetical protein
MKDNNIIKKKMSKNIDFEKEHEYDKFEREWMEREKKTIQSSYKNEIRWTQFVRFSFIYCFVILIWLFTLYIIIRFTIECFESVFYFIMFLFSLK